MATPKTELKPYTWWFLFVGSVPYKGFFTHEDALAEAQKFEKSGYDTYIRTSPAFSTLGWFDDPLLAHLLRYERVTLAEVIFHELFHNTLYVSGAGAFNESMANFVGGNAAIAYFRERSGEGSADHLRAIEAWKEQVEFSRFLGGVAASLTELYARKLLDAEKLRLREEIFERAQKDWAAETAKQPRNRYRSFSQAKINNAMLANYLLYLKDLDLFESVYQLNGKDLGLSVTKIKDAVKGGKDPFDGVRVLAQRLEEQSSQAGNRLPKPPDSGDVIRGPG